MYSLRPHKKFDFVKYWKYGFRLSGVLIALAIIGFVVSTVFTGAPLTLGTEFSGGTSIQINDAGSVTEDELKSAFESAARDLGYDTQISSIQTSDNLAGGNGYIVKTTDTVSTNASEIMNSVEDALGIDGSTVEIETIGASWGASVIWSSIIAFILSCIGILIVIAIRYREPRMGVVALVCLFHDMIVVLGIYAWAGLFFHMEITSDVIAALLAIIGYSLYDTVVVFHRISRNASPQMKCNLFTCANQSLNEVIVRSINTSITSIIPVLFMLILGTDTLLDFAFAMFCGMVVGIYSTLAISAPLYTYWKAKEPAYVRLDNKYPYEVVQSPFTKQMMLEARTQTVERLKVQKHERDEAREAEREEAKRLKEEQREAERQQLAAEREAEKLQREEERATAARLKQEEKEEREAAKREREYERTATSDHPESDDDVFITLEGFDEETLEEERREKELAREALAAEAPSDEELRSATSTTTANGFEVSYATGLHSVISDDDDLVEEETVDVEDAVEAPEGSEASSEDSEETSDQ